MHGEDLARPTFVICCECGSSIFTNDPESILRQDERTVMLRCLNNCCGHVGNYLLADLRTASQSRIFDHITNILLHG